jgi:hypothetical protein
MSEVLSLVKVSLNKDEELLNKSCNFLNSFDANTIKVFHDDVFFHFLNLLYSVTCRSSLQNYIVLPHRLINDPKFDALAKYPLTHSMKLLA